MPALKVLFWFYLVADDHASVRYGIQSLLRRAGDIIMVGEAGDGAEAVKLVKELSPDVVVMDITMPQMDGIQATEQVAGLETRAKVLIISVHTDSSLVERALVKGASGYLAKANLADQLVLAVRLVHAGNLYLGPGISRGPNDQE